MKFVFVLVLTLSVTVLAIGQAKNDNSSKGPDDETVLREHTNRWLEADAKGDAPTVNILLADEFSFLGGKSRAEYLLSMNPDPTLNFVSAVVEDQKIQIYGETAIVTGLNSYRFKKDGTPIQAKFPSLTVWVKKNGRWQCVNACTLPALPS